MAMSKNSVPTGLSSSRMVSSRRASGPSSPAASTAAAPLSTSTTSNFPLGSGPSAVGASNAAGGDSISLAILAALLPALAAYRTDVAKWLG